MRDFEGLGSFYLGCRYDSAAGRATDEPILYDARDLTTHAICVRLEAVLTDADAELKALSTEFDAELAPLQGAAAPVEIEAFAVAPRKADLGVSRLVLAWVGGDLVG